MLKLLWFTTAVWIVQAAASDLRDIKAQCSRSGMTVHVVFDRPFHGIVFSKDHYDVPKCNYVTDNNNGKASYSFNIPLRGCGTASHMGSPNDISNFQRSLDLNEEVFLENTLIIQQDPYIQEAGDTARRLRCVWRNNLQKAVNAKLPEVYKPLVMTVRMDYRAVDHITDVQLGKGPLSIAAKGFISTVPNYSSLVIYLKDPNQRFDANVLGCSYTNFRGELITLTNDDGCSTRPDLTSPFYKTRDSQNSYADVTLYTYFRNFKVPRDPYFSITCNVEICFSRCGDRCRTLVPAF